MTSNSPYLQQGLLAGLRRLMLKGCLGPCEGCLEAEAWAELCRCQAPQSRPSGSAVNVVDDTTSVCLMLKGILDPVKEIAKLQDKRVSSLA